MKALKYMMMGMLVSLTASCGNDWLDVESSTKIPTETAIQNLDDVEYSLNGIYDVMRSTNYYSGMRPKLRTMAFRRRMPWW